MLKKILKIVGIIVILIVIAIILLPVIFKDNIVEKVKTEANANLNAKVDFGEFGLSLFSNFPDFTFTIDNVSVVGIDAFEGDTLADIGHLEVTVDIMSIINGGQIKIKTLAIEAPKILAKVLEDGRANWDIAKESEEEVSEEVVEEEGSFDIGLSHYSITNADIIYEDATMNLYTEIKNLNHSGQGDFTQDLFVLKTLTEVESITLDFDNIKYMNKAKFSMKMDLDMDMPNFKFTFKENEIQLNELFLGFDGFIAMPQDDIDMDIAFHAKKTEFKNLLSMVPAVYATDFASVKTNGTLALNGFAKGVYNEKQLPAFNLELFVKDAMFKYPDMPGSAENIQIEVKIDNPGGSEDNTNINIDQFHVEMMDNPIDMTMSISTPVSDPNINCTIQSQIDLSNIQQVVPLEEGEQYSGSITANVSLRGKLSSLENEQYEDFHAAGEVIVLDLNYKSEDIPYGMLIKKMYLNFTPQFVAVNSFESLIGKSDFNAKGKVENFLAYTFKDEALRGTFDMNSQLIDLNEFMEEEETATTTPAEGTEEELSVFEVPSNIDFVMNANIKKLLYDNMELNNVVGGIAIKESKVDLTALKMNMLDGKLMMNGYYETTDIKKPTFDFGLVIEQFDVPKTFATFNTVQKLAPIAENATGKFSTTMKLNGPLDEHMDPILDLLFGDGKLTTHNVVIENSGVLGKAADVLKMNSLKKITMNDVNISYHFSNGRVTVDPFDFKIGSGKANVYGSNGFDQSLDYTMNIDIPTSELGGAATLANSLLGSVGASLGDRVNMDVLIGGTVTNPTIMPSMKNTTGSLKDDLKAKAKDEIDKKKSEIEDKAKAEAERLKQEAEQKAREEADKLKKEAEAKAKAEADKKKKELEEKLKNETKNKLKGVFGKPK